jgi:hypothetical protein
VLKFIGLVSCANLQPTTIPQGAPELPSTVATSTKSAENKIVVDLPPVRSKILNRRADVTCRSCQRPSLSPYNGQYPGRLIPSVCPAPDHPSGHGSETKFFICQGIRESDPASESRRVVTYSRIRCGIIVVFRIAHVKFLCSVRQPVGPSRVTLISIVEPKEPKEVRASGIYRVGVHRGEARNALGF